VYDTSTLLISDNTLVGCCSMDNNAKLALMLEVFQEQDESLHTVMF
jgi:hypothetical protein